MRGAAPCHRPGPSAGGADPFFCHIPPPPPALLPPLCGPVGTPAASRASCCSTNTRGRGARTLRCLLLGSALPDSCQTSQSSRGECGSWGSTCPSPLLLPAMDEALTREGGGAGEPGRGSPAAFCSEASEGWFFSIVFLVYIRNLNKMSLALAAALVCRLCWGAASGSWGAPFREGWPSAARSEMLSGRSGVAVSRAQHFAHRSG